MSAFYDQASLVVVPSGYKSGKIYAQKPLTTDGQLTFTRASTATRVNSAGLIETVASNVPRLDYQGSTCPKLLLEPQTTALNQYSEAFDNAYWIKNVATIVANHAISPDGTQNADLLYPTSAGVSRYVLRFVGATSGLTYTTSVFAKASGKNWLGMSNVDSGATTAWFNLSTGTVGTVRSGTTATITNYGNGWYRCTVTRTATATLGAIVLLVEDADNSDNVIPNGTDGILLWGCNLTQSSYATSYVKTEAAAVTRLADQCYKQSISSLIGQSEGTIYLEADIQKRNESGFYVAISSGFSLGSSIYLYQLSSGSLQLLIRNTGNPDSSITINSANWTAGVNKVAIAYTATTAEVFINGVSKGSTSFVSLPTLSQLTLGGRPDFPGSLVGAGPYSQALLFKTRLTNAQLAELTAL